MQEAVSREIECTDFDFGGLSFPDETNVVIGDHGFHFEMAVGRNDEHQLLRRRDDASKCMNGELLDGSIDRCT